jgi:hypothetical protein
MKHWLLAALLLGACAHRGPSVQPALGRVILVAGGPEDGTHRALGGAGLNHPFGAALDRSGNLFIVEEMANRVHKVDARGMVTVYAGTGSKGDGGDGGPATAAVLNNPHHLAFAPGNFDDLLVTDTLNGRIRKIDRAGIITTIAGSTKGFGGDGGPATQAQFSSIFAMAFAGDTMYLADLGNRRIRSVNLRTGMTATVAGNGEKGVPPDGADARQAPLLDPRAVAADSQGNVYIVERNGHVLRVVDRAGKIRTVAGTGQKGAGGDGGPALSASFNGPKHVTVDGNDDVLITDTENHVIRKYLPREGRVVLVAGNYKQGSDGVGGPPDQVSLNRPHGVFVAPDGSLYISDSENQRVLRLQR